MSDDTELLGGSAVTESALSPVDKLDFNELKQWCSMFGVKAEPTWKKVDYVTAIKRHIEEQNEARVVKEEEAKNAPAPGYARVRFNKDATPGASNRAVFMGVNGRIMQAPRGIIVDIPLPFLEVMDNSMTTHTQNTNPNAPIQDQKFEEISAQSYPYSVLATTPGKFDNPNDQRLQNYKQRYFMAEKYKHWPTAGELKSAMDRGVFDQPEFKNFVLPAV